MSVAKSPFRVGGGSVSGAPGSAGAAAAAAGGANRAVSTEELQDALASTFLGKERWASLRAFLRATAQADALPAANFRKLVAFAVKHIEQGVSFFANGRASPPLKQGHTQRSDGARVLPLRPASCWLIVFSLCCPSLTHRQSLPEETRVKIYTDPSILLYFTFALEVLQSALAQHTKEAAFSADLAKLQIKSDYVNEMANAYKQR